MKGWTHKWINDWMNRLIQEYGMNKCIGKDSMMN